MIPGNSGSSRRIGGTPVPSCRDSGGDVGFTSVDSLEAVTPVARDTLLSVWAVSSSGV